MEPAYKALENRLRRKAKKLGLKLTKSWAANEEFYGPMGYRIIDKYNSILAGSCEVLLLTELSDIMDQMEKEIEEVGEVYSVWD